MSINTPMMTSRLGDDDDDDDDDDDGDDDDDDEEEVFTSARATAVPSASTMA